MKNISLILASLLFLIVVSCKEEDTEGEPIVWYHYYAFVDENGNDFFQSYAEYYETVGIFTPNFNGTGTNGVYSFEDSTQIDLINIFGTGLWGGSRSYFSFRNGDIDTLTKTWKPASVQSLAAQFDELDEITFSYNGKVVETWDFVENPELLNELKRRNVNSTKFPTATNPIFIKIVKEPDLDELD